MSEKIKYKDLSLPLKLGVVFAHILFYFYALFFLIGLFEGIKMAITG